MTSSGSISTSHLFPVTIKPVLFFIIVALALSSCNVAYIPNKHNVPLLEEKGDASVSISTTNLQGAYAFSDHVAVITNLYFRENNWDDIPDTNNTITSDYHSNRFLAEAGLGYFKQLGNEGVFEIYGGGGIGNLGFEQIEYNSSLDRTYQATISKAFIQPDIGFQTEYFDLVFSTRFSYLGFHNVDTSNYNLRSLEQDKLYNLDKQAFFFLEPALTLKFGYKFINAYTQAIVATKLNPQRLNYRNFGVNMGIELDLGEIIYKL